MDLFDLQRETVLKKEAPLAARLRPASLEEFVGQQHIVGKNTLLYRAILADKLSSVVFYGPPGTGKTTLARIIAARTASAFTPLNATTAGIKDIKTTVEDARHRLATSGNRTILFVDEIHRFNKSQQDALLPHVEDGTIILVGATTENPYFEVNKALLSRSSVFELHPLSQEDIAGLLRRAATDKEKGLGMFPLHVAEDAFLFLADVANGDARTALNALELAALTTQPAANGAINITLEEAAACIQKRAINYDKNGDMHYDTISAFIKSMRGSDPDAAVYYLARMLYAGEDPKFIARRILICAAEDVGNADPHALMLASAATQAVEFVGLPEGRIILAQAATYIACAPKSNAAITSIEAAMQDVQHVRIKGIPAHLQDTHYPGAAQLGKGQGYQYAHTFPGNYVPQQYLPDELAGKTYYHPTENGVEKKIKESLEKRRKQPVSVT